MEYPAVSPTQRDHIPEKCCLESKNAAAHESGNPRLAPDRLDGIRVLLVDDSRDNRILICKFLTLAGASVETAENGLQGIEKCLALDVDVVLMDLQMPVMDGYEAVISLRKQHGYEKPILALTAHAQREERMRCLALGFDCHLSKPIDRKVLINHIQMAAHHRRETIDKRAEGEP